MNTKASKKIFCLLLLCCFTISLSAQGTGSVSGPKKRKTTTTTVQQNQGASQQRQSTSSVIVPKNRNATTTPVQQNQGTSQQRQGSGTNAQQHTSDSNVGTQQVVEPQPPTSTISTSQRVDLGLSVYWAGYNVGASSPEKYGDYFAWGETSPKSSDTVAFGRKISWLKKKGYVDSNNNLTLEHDAARANWGGSWRMPTEAECKELIDKCKWELTTYGGKEGYKVTGPNGNSIFLPAAGNKGSVGGSGYYWCSSSFAANDTYFSSHLNFGASYQIVSLANRHERLTVRPVSVK